MELGIRDSSVTQGRSLAGDITEPVDSVRYNNGREFNVTPLNYGYIVRVGCQTVAIQTKDLLISLLTDYINNPSEIEEKYFKNEILIK